MPKKAQMILSCLAGLRRRLAFPAILLGLLVSPVVSAPTIQQLSKEEIQEYLSKIASKDAQWEENRKRDKSERPSEIIKLIDVQPGMRIGEVGAGFGYFTFHLSEKVGENGVVYANDIDKYALIALEFYAREFGALKNIIPVLALDDDPCFPSQDLDMIVAYGCFHDIKHKEVWLRNTVKYLKPNGTLAIIDGYWPKHGALTLDKIRSYGAQAGFSLILHRDFSFGERSHHVHLLKRIR